MTPSAAVAPPLREMMNDYLQVRRALGFKLEGTERLLHAFADYLHEHAALSVTVEHAVAFATARPGASPRWQALRLSAIRQFTRWAHVLDPTMQVPCWPSFILPISASLVLPMCWVWDGPARWFRAGPLSSW